MQLKIVQYFILLMLFLSSCCCDNYDFYKIENIEENEVLTEIKFNDLKTFFQNIVENKNQNIKDINNKGEFSIKYIKHENISLKQVEEFTQIKNYWNEEKIGKLKEQIQFSTIVSYPYYIEFLLRLKKLLIDKKNGISFFTSIGGSGRSIHYPCGYNLRNIVNRNENFLNVTNNDFLNKDNRQTRFPIFLNNNIFVKNNNILTFFENRLKIQFEDDSQVKYKYICSVLEYLAQLGNPIFTIYGRGVQQSAAAYNIALMLKELFKFDTEDFFYEGEYSILDIFESNGDKAGFKNNTEIIKQLEEVGASAEKDVIMLAGAITLNNLLYKIFRSVRAMEKDINCVLGFESYSGRVWELLVAIWKENYQKFQELIDEKIVIKKNELQCILTHCLIGNNKLLPQKNIGEKGEVTIDTPQILKDLVNGNNGLGEDRLYYLDCDKICGYKLNEIVDFWKNLTGRPTLQIISNIKNNNGNGFLGSIKHFFRYEWDHLITSYFNSPYNDGMLSDDGLFIYMGNENFENFCKNIFKDYTSGENLEEILNDNYELKILEDDPKTFYINDKTLNIIYIVVGHGTHIENKRNNPYNGYFENITKILNKIENKIE